MYNRGREVEGLYPNIPHEEGLISIRKALDTGRDKTIFILKNNIFEHDKSVLKQLRGTAIGTKITPPYAIIFMDSLEEHMLSNSLLKPLVQWRYIDDIFMM